MVFVESNRTQMLFARPIRRANKQIDIDQSKEMFGVEKLKIRQYGEEKSSDTGLVRENIQRAEKVKGWRELGMTRDDAGTGQTKSGLQHDKWLTFLLRKGDCISKEMTMEHSKRTELRRRVGQYDDSWMLLDSSEAGEAATLYRRIVFCFKGSIICVHSLQTEKPPQRIGSGKYTWTKIISTNTTTGTTTVFGIPTTIKIFNLARHQQKANDIKESIPMDGVKAAEEMGHKVLFVRITVTCNQLNLFRLL
ncbi:hypothetical protein IV203_032556 [Nitzschia inconspicua]|uniref:Uncharacterized protein n=1 Tax=Nitzschia inconspicua TaxID=303405 RepID=A0A9K3PF56_9STRA|nr:hypothetical protein IV203_032556 [Nitzschia inconspicua]